MSLQPTTSREIGGREFTIRKLNLADARAVYTRIQRFLPVFADDNVAQNASAFQLAGTGGHVDDDTFKFLIEKFAPTTTVALSPEQSVTLRSTADQEKVFGQLGDFGDIFEWVDACIDHNFRSAIEKLKGAAQRLEARAKEQEEQASRSQKDSTGSSGES